MLYTYLLVITKGAVFFRARGGMGNTIYLLDFVRETMVREWRGGRECSPGQKYHVFSGFFSSPSAVGEGVLRIIHPVELGLLAAKTRKRAFRLIFRFPW